MYICRLMTEFAHDKIVPDQHSALSKKEQVADMFNSIALRYDFLNHFLSAGIDVYWRKIALKQLAAIKPQSLLDVATGTGDLAIMAEKILKPTKIIGIDISEGMLEIGRQKIKKAGLEHIIELSTGDSEAIKHPNNSFDAVTVSFGVRNFEHLELGLSEIYRVLKPGGKLVILEFSKPKGFLIKFIYNFYMKIITPLIGKMISKNKNAYSYLDASIKKFPEGKEFIKVLDEIGYQNTQSKTLSLGICTIYFGIK